MTGIIATKLCPTCSMAVSGFTTEYAGDTWFSDHGLVSHQDPLKTIRHILRPCGCSVRAYEITRQEDLIVYSWVDPL